jgi:hypothetical protein
MNGSVVACRMPAINERDRPGVTRLVCAARLMFLLSFVLLGV